MVEFAFTSRTPIGLDIGTRQIKAVQLVQGGEGARPRLAAVAVIERDAPAKPELSTSETPRRPGAGVHEEASARGKGGNNGDDAPVSISVEEVRRLRRILNRQGFSGRRVVMAAPPTLMVTSVLELPPRSSGAPLAQIARNELAHAHRCDASKMEVVFWDLPLPARSAPGTAVMAAGCAHERADRLLTAVGAGGFDVMALDMSGWSLARACELIEETQEEAGGITAVVDLGWREATLVLLHERIVVYERMLSSAGIEPLFEALTARCGFDSQVIEYLLRDVGFEADRRDRDDNAGLMAKAHGPLEAWCDGLAQELRLAMSYAQHQYPQAPVSRVLLTGGGAEIPGLAEHLTPEMDATVRAFMLDDALERTAGMGEKEAGPVLTIAAGLALFDEKEAMCCAA